MSNPLLITSDVELDRGIRIPDMSISSGEIFWLECENHLCADVFASFMLSLLKIKKGDATLSGLNIDLHKDHSVISYLNLNWSIYVDDVQKLVKYMAYSGEHKFSSAMNEFKRILEGLGSAYILDMKLSEMTPATKRITSTSISLALPSLIILLEEPFLDIDETGSAFMKKELDNIIADGSSIIIMSESAPPSYMNKAKLSCWVTQ